MSEARKDGGGWGVALGALLLAACCGLPIVIVLGAGILASIGGLAARYWPLTALGLAALVWGGFKFRRLAARRRALSERDGVGR